MSDNFIYLSIIIVTVILILNDKNNKLKALNGQYIRNIQNIRRMYINKDAIFTDTSISQSSGVSSGSTGTNVYNSITYSDLTNATGYIF